MKRVDTWIKLCARNIECTRSLQVSKGKENRQHVSMPKNIRHSFVCAIVCDCLLCLLYRVKIRTQILIAARYPPKNR